MNLVEGLHHELVRCKELVKIYDSLAMGAFGGLAIKVKIKAGEKALGNGDVVEMIIAYEELKRCK